MAATTAAEMPMSTSMSGMDQSSMDSSMTMDMSQMRMIFFESWSTPLYSAAWTPSTVGQYAGTCIFLIILAFIMRALIAAKAVFEVKARARAFRRRYIVTPGPERPSSASSNDSETKTTATLTAKGLTEHVRIVERAQPVPGGSAATPWRFSTDLPRALLVTTIVGVGYLLMLAVMTMNTGYFISHTMFSATALHLAFLPLLASAHFHLDFPEQRDANDDNQGTWPCSGQDSPSDTRTELPLNAAFPIQLDLEHTTNKIQVLVALGNSPTGNDFTYVLRPTIQERGPQDFCLGGVTIPSSWNIAAGTNATIHVGTDSHEGGKGLYNCADVTFTEAALSQATYDDNCKNSTGVSVESTASGLGNPNGTTTQAPAGNASPAGTSTGAAPAATSSGAASGLIVGAGMSGAQQWTAFAVMMGVAGGMGLLL
ncbi:hypothetical protein FH972_021313 [Carpinus fangiana]|uniref:Copper transport protein n=1 Tax=Carpinus fangiana TaxID=176857 RepID=A0A5N6KPJ4_9ROSI|nr:hypothetical protein FH972_021313 [Carpinus fangiana]